MPPLSLGIASLSLGSFEHHTLPAKIAAAADAGFSNIELFDNDWWAYRDSYAAAHGLDPSTGDGDATSLLAAGALGALVQSFNMTISCWQPLRNFEGFLDPEDRRKSRAFAKGILDIMPALGTSLLLCCTTSTGAPKTTGDLDRCVEDLTWLVDEAAKYDPPIRIVYEGLSFAAHRRTWQEAWEVVEKVNRPTIGLAVDTFNILALEYADPYNPSGTGRIYDQEAVAVRVVEQSMAHLAAVVPGNKIFIVQLADGQLMDPRSFHRPEDPSVPPLRPWSRGHRLFPMEQQRGGYLPVAQVLAAVLSTGCKCPLSLEVFNDSLSLPDKSVPLSHAKRGMAGLQKLLQVTQATPRVLSSL